MPEPVVLADSLEAVLTKLADEAATGCLRVRDQQGDEAEVYLRDGEIYSVFVPGRRTMLGVRLLSRGALAPEALAEALEIQRTELQGWRLGELLVHLDYVDLAVVEEFVVEHLKDALADLLGWPVAAWKFKKGRKTRQDVAPPTSVAKLMDELRDRAVTWEAIVAATGGPDAMPWHAPGAPPADDALGGNEWALYCKVDGTRSVAQLASECGFTLYETGQVVMALAAAGLLETGAAATPAGTATEAPEVDDAAVATTELVLSVVALEAAELAEAEQAVREEAERRAAEQIQRAVEDAERALADPPESVSAEKVAEPHPENSRETSLRVSRATSLLTDLNRSEPLRMPVDEEEIVEPIRLPVAEPEPDGEQSPEPMVVRDQADNAMLLRELAHLGDEPDDPAEPEAPATPSSRPGRHTSATPDAGKKKRKGLFTRG